MTKKNSATLFPLLITFSVMHFDCQPTKLSYTQDGDWVNRADFPGWAVGEAAVFTIGDYAYIGTGVDISHPNTRLTTIYQFDPSGNGGWTQVADFAGAPRSSAVGFSVGSKGYIATGYDGFQSLSDCWEYDPSTNLWTQKASISDGTKKFPRYDAIGFGIGDFGYVSTGYTGNGWLEDLWQYNPQQNSWIQKRGMGKKRSAAVCMVYDGKAFVFTGSNNNKLLDDGWAFDPKQPDSSAWTELNRITNFTSQDFDDSYSNLIRNNGVAFVIGNKGYLTTGNSGSINISTWEYDFANDRWKPKTPFFGSPREGAVGFSVRNRGFVSTGYSGTTAFDDLWEFLPEKIQNQ